MTLQEIEIALARNNLWMLMQGGKYWCCRRNGATKRWKREPDRFEIPVKAGLKACGRVTSNEVGYAWGDLYVISPDKPIKCGPFEHEMRRAASC